MSHTEPAAHVRRITLGASLAGVETHAGHDNDLVHPDHRLSIIRALLHSGRAVLLDEFALRAAVLVSLLLTGRCALGREDAT